LELESRGGMRVGRLTQGGVLGEAETLGLFGTRMVTARALTECRILVVTEAALQAAMASPCGKSIGEGFAALVASRRQQVAQGKPLCALPIGAKADDVTVRAVVLQAERMHFEQGQCWKAIPDNSPCGSHISVLLRGKAVVELAADDSEVMPLAPGSIVAEGVIAEYGAHVRLLSSDCEVYRMRFFELVGAAYSASQAPDWFYQFRLLEKEARKHQKARLTSAKGVALGRTEHPGDSGIRDWAEERKQKMRRAQEMRQEKATSVLSSKLPLLPVLSPRGFGTTAARSWKAGPKKALSLFHGHPPGPPVFNPKDLAMYPALRLPRVQSEPHLRRNVGGARQREQASWQD